MKNTVRKHRNLASIIIILIFCIGLGLPGTVLAAEKAETVCFVEPAAENRLLAAPQCCYTEDSLSAKEMSVRDTLIKGVESLTQRIDISQYKIGKEEFWEIWLDLCGNQGTFFVTGGSCSYYVSGGIVTVVMPGYDSRYTVKDIQKYVAKRKAVLATVVKSGMTDLEKALAIHDYLVAHNSYDLSYTGYSAYDALIRQTSVCDGYAKCYSDLLNSAKVNAKRVTSDVMKHAWNVVKIDDDWYHVDCTWDDPVRSGTTLPSAEREHPAEGFTGRVGHKNFMLSDDGISGAGSSGHRGWTKIVTCSNKKYDDGNVWGNLTAACIFIEKDCYTMMSGTDGFGLYRNFSEKMCSMEDRWMAGNGGWWTASFCSLTEDNGYLFYNDTKNVYAVRPGKKNPQKVYTYTKSGDIYGCLVENGKAILLIHDGSTTTNYNATDRSLKVTLKLEETENLAAPSLTSATYASKGVKVKWEAVKGAEKYKVMRKKKGGSWTSVGLTSKTSYTDTTAVSGTTYYYTVRCVSADGKKNTSSYQKTGLKIRYIKRSTPKLSSVIGTAQGVKIKWSAVSGAVNYMVMRKVSGGSWKSVGYTTGTGFLDKKAKSGKTYTYTVRCVSADGKTYQSDYNTKGLTIRYKKLDSPELISLKNTSKGVKINWGKVSGAVNYKVMRKSSGGNWTSVGYTTGVSFTDKTAKNGKTYVYTVRCVTADGKDNTSDYNKTGLKIKCKR